MTIRISIIFGACALALSTGVGQVTEPALNSTAAGRRVQEYLAAFNSGSDSTMRAFFERNLAKDAGQRIPLDQRIERYREMRSMAGTFTLKKVIESIDSGARLLVDSKAGFTLRMDFRCEPAPPYGLQTIEIQPAQPADEGISAMKDDSALVTAVDGYLRDLANADKFSGVVLVAKRGRPLVQKAYGLSNKERSVPNTHFTRFNLGSMNKSFTQVAIDQLAAKGKLSLSDPIERFLPNYPNKVAAKNVTVGHLYAMTSGIGDFFNERYDTTPKKTLNSIQGYMPLFADKPLLFEPGAKMQYSNGGYIVLGAIIEKVSGLDYYTYVRKNIFDPAGMASTDSYDKDCGLPDLAVGYTLKDSVRRSNYDVLPQRGSSAGGGYSTADDLLRYTEALADSPFIPSTYHGRRGLGIAGGMEGVNSALEWDPHNGYAVVVLSNYDPPIAQTIAQRIRAWIPR